MGSSTEYARNWYAKNRDSIREQRRYRRRTDVGRAILQDTRREDRKRGRANDLTLEFVDALISHPCSYCGEESLRRSLDRIDNTKGHTQDNVVLACERCNFMRRDMPFEAWLIVAEAMRLARVTGKFGEWTGSIHKRREAINLVIRKQSHPDHGTLAGYKRCGPPRCELCKKAMADWKRSRRSIKRA